MAIVLDPTNGITNVNGTAAAPALTGADTNTGIFYGTDIVGISTGGSERVRVDASGNVGIGTTTPANKFEVFGNGVGSTLRIAARGNTTAATSIIEAQSFDYWSSSVFTGTSLRQSGSTATGTTAGLSNANLGSLVFQNGSAGLIYTNGSSPIVIGTTNVERMRIDSSGNVQIGKTSTSTLSAGINLGSLPNFIANTASPSDGPYIQISNIAASVANGFRYISFRVGSSGNEAGSISTNGSSTVSYVTSSDYRLKDNIVPMTGALDKVLQLKPCTYTWKSDNSNGQGFIAHELAEIVPDCVTGEKDAVNEDGSIKPQGVDTSFLVATLTAAIQEQQTIINDLKARIETLEAKK